MNLETMATRADEHRTDPPPEPIRPGRYRGWIGPADVIGVALHCEAFTNATLVVFRWPGDEQLRAMPLDEFRRIYERLPDGADPPPPAAPTGGPD